MFPIWLHPDLLIYSIKMRFIHQSHQVESQSGPPRHRQGQVQTARSWANPQLRFYCDFHSLVDHLDFHINFPSLENYFIV